jgi:hypothetical protein
MSWSWTGVKTLSKEQKEQKDKENEKAIWITYEFWNPETKQIEPENMRMKRNQADGLGIASLCLSKTSDIKAKPDKEWGLSFHTNTEQQQELITELNQATCIYVYHASQFFAVLKNYCGNPEKGDQWVWKWRAKSRSLFEYLHKIKKVTTRPTQSELIKQNMTKLFQEVYQYKTQPSAMEALKIWTIHSTKIFYTTSKSSHYTKVEWPLYMVFTVW